MLLMPVIINNYLFLRTCKHDTLYFPVSFTSVCTLLTPFNCIHFVSFSSFDNCNLHKLYQCYKLHFRVTCSKSTFIFTPHSFFIFVVKKKNATHTFLQQHNCPFEGLFPPLFFCVEANKTKYIQNNKCKNILNSMEKFSTFYRRASII